MGSPANLSTLMQYGGYLAIVLLVIAGTYLLFFCIRLFLNRRYLKRRTVLWLELTPPAQLAKTPESTMQLFSVIHGLRSACTFKDKLLGRLPTLSLEIVSTKRDGVRYLIQVERSIEDTIHKSIAAYIPEAKVKEVEYTPPTARHVYEFKQAHHYILPLASTKGFEQHDPLSYITAAMTKLSENEQLTMQIVLLPVKLKDAARYSSKIMQNEDMLHHVSKSRLSFLSSASNLLSGAMLSATDTIGEVYNGSTSSYYASKSSKDANFQQQVQKRQRPARTLSAFELELMETMHQKVTQPLFQVNLRVMASGDSSKKQLTTLRSALDGYGSPPYQSLETKTRLPILNFYRKHLADKRLPSIFKSHALILSATEVSSLFHFPSNRISRTDNLITSLSRTLPAPVSLKQHNTFDVILGMNAHHGIQTPIGLTEAERERHVYIIGGTGNGKTTMMQYAIVQDMQNGKGVAIIDPHGDMAETLLRHVPPERVKDVVYFNPDDLQFPIGLNLLEMTPGVTGNELLREKDIITESVISVFRKIFSEEDTGGHRIEYVLRNTIQTALTVDDATLFAVFDLLNDTKFRKKIIKTLEDKNLINFWKNELGKAGDMQKVKMAAGITSKIGRFLFSASAKQILEQPKSTIDFDDIINSGKILICNFSKGLLGEDTSELFGITVLAKLQLASLRRARIPQAERRHFYLYVDEFQNFATTSFVQMLSESRKYKMFMIMAEQSTSQQKDQQMVSIILANVGTVITFRSGNPDDERLLLPLFSPYIDPGEMSNLPAFNFYAKLSAIKPQEPLSGQTILLPDKGDEMIAQKAVELSRASFAKKQDEPTAPDTSKEDKENTQANQPAGAHSINTEPIIDEM
ncbi:MAG TPA: type IV secretion system DNA-binding domain-containing protein [Candidatus Saccharibacteria bacterium]|nr:type IV secretion system DNA-binding domain-containing protein [Candidatus Saccharibacteria bacterium]